VTYLRWPSRVSNFLLFLMLLFGFGWSVSMMIMHR
jgi:hypothetical protein